MNAWRRFLLCDLGHMWRGIFFAASCGFRGLAGGRGRVRVVPSIWRAGTVSANVGRLCARTRVAASKPEASLIKVGSLNAVPKKLMPSGAPKTIPAGTCTIGYPGAAARPDVPKMK